MKKVVRKIFALCLLFNLQINSLGASALADEKVSTSKSTKKTLRSEKNIEKTKFEGSGFSGFTKSEMLSISGATLGGIGAIAGSATGLSHILEKLKNNSVRDYFVIGLRRQKGENDPEIVKDFISTELAKQGIHGFTVYEGYGAWTEEQEKSKWYEPSLVFFVDGKRDQTKKIDRVINNFLNARDEKGASKFDQISVLRSTVTLRDANLAYKDHIQKLL